MSDEDSQSATPDPTPASETPPPAGEETVAPPPPGDAASAEPAPADVAGDLMAAFDFAPSWAKEGNDSPDKWRKFEGRDNRSDTRGRGRDARFGGPRRDDRRGSPDSRGGPARRDGPRDAPRGGPPRGAPDGFRRMEGRPSEAAPRAAGPHDGPRGDDRRFQRDNRGGFRPPPRLPVRIDFLPDRPTLAKIVAIIRKSCQAVTLEEIAQRFLAHPDAMQVKIHPREGVPAEETVVFFQVKPGGAIFLDRAEAESNALLTGLPEVYDTEEVEVAPPAGNFSSVAKCGITGELLGPTNHHCFAENAERVRAERCPDVPPEDFKRRVILMREPEAIEAWKQAQTKVVRYGEKGAAEKTLTRREAEHAFRANHLAKRIGEARRLIVSMRAAMAVSAPIFARQLRDCMEREKSHPFSILLALRPALKHMGLHFFKARGGQQFVSGSLPARLDPANVTGPIRALLEYLADHPGCKREAILEHLHPGATRESEASAHLGTHLRWLLEKGHIIEFSDATYELPRPRPEDTPKAPSAAEPAAEASGEAPAEPVEGEPAGAPPAEPAEGEAAGATPPEPVEPAAPSTPTASPDEAVAGESPAPDAPPNSADAP